MVKIKEVFGRRLWELEMKLQKKDVWKYTKYAEHRVIDQPKNISN